MSVVTITIGGNDETANVLFETARFESSVNGVGGPCNLRIRDLDRSKTFTPGQTLVLEIDGTVEWRGFVAVATRTYVFPALNVTEFGLSRFIDITGVDVNVLLTKRIVFDQSNGANVTAPLLPAHTADNDAIATLVADWLDLSGDGLDTSSLVENVGDTTWTQSGRAWEGSDTWAQAMQSIATLPAAIYYIDPDLNLVYTDVDTPSAAFGLSDQPNGTTTKGYREMEVLKDGSALANDVLAWGMGYGSNAPIFDRETDATSQSIHGLWQQSSLNFGVYKQATLNRIAQSIIDGSPQSKRGAKDDRVSVMCVTYEPGLRVAQKVDFTSATFGFNDVIPIRKMTITFSGPSTPKYSLVLSHEIDAPLSLIDNIFFNFRFPPIGFPCIPPMVMGPNGYCILPPTSPGPDICPPSVCGITDSFQRTETGTLGTSDSGLVWRDYVNESLWSASAGIATATVTGGEDIVAASLQGGVTHDILVYGQITASGTASPDDVWRLGADTLPDFAQVTFATDGTLTLEAGSDSDSTTLAFDATSAFKCRLQAAGANAQVRVWLLTDPEPSSWTLTAAFDVPTTVFDFDIYFQVQRGSGHADLTGTYSVLDAQDINRCATYLIDDFQRNETGGWGDASSGGTWVTTPGTGSEFGVTNGAGYFNVSDPDGSSGTATLPFTPSPPITEGPIDAYTDLWVDPIPLPTGLTDIQWFVALGSDLNTNMIVNLDFNGDTNCQFSLTYTDSNGDGGGSVGMDMGFPLLGEWLSVHMQLSDSGLRGSIWPRGTTEPVSFQQVSDADFTAQLVTDLTGVPLAVGYSTVDGSGRAHSDPPLDHFTRYDNINNGYPGKPCFPCIDALPFSNFLVDSFGRSVVNGWAAPEVGPRWRIPTGNTQAATWSVSGGNGVQAYDSATDNPDTPQIQVVADMPHKGVLVFKVMYPDPGVAFTGAGFTLDYGSNWRFEAIFDPSGNGTAFALIQSGGVANGGLPYNNTGTPISIVRHTIAYDIQYWVFMEFDETTVTGQMWPVGDSPPGPQIGFGDHGPAGSINDMTIAFAHNRTVSTGASFDDFNVVDYDPGCPDSTPVPSVPLSGYVSENQVSNGSNIITTQHPFLPNSTSVSVAGLLYSQSTYTENPTAGTITLNFFPSPGDPIKVSYWSATAPTAAGVVYSFPSSGTLSDLLTKMADMTIDVIEMEAGTYSFASTSININRMGRPLIVRPAVGALVTFSGSGSGGAFYFGLGGVAAYITMQDFALSGYTIGDTGIMWLGNASHITLNNMTVHTVTATGTGPIYSWALYLSEDAGVAPTYIVADNWTVTGSSHNFSALQVGHPPSTMTSITARNWTVTDLAYAIYAYGTVSAYIVSGWLITNCVRSGTSDTVFFGASVTGIYSNMTAVSSGGLESQGGMTNGGGNSGL